MATKNRLSGAERIRGELLKLHLRLAKRRIQKYMRRVREPRPPSQRWSTFPYNHAHEIWACDFLQIYDLLFRSTFAFFFIEIGTRRIGHVGVTRTPSSASGTQHVREATAWSEGPRFLSRDNDDKFGTRFDEVAEDTGGRVIRTSVRVPSANALCERFLRSVRTECLDHVIFLGEDHPGSVLRDYCSYFNVARLHQRIGQTVPNGPPEQPNVGSVIEEVPRLGDLHHEYRLAA
jgi:putative transposase